MPKPFVYRILKKMENGGLVAIIRGRVGGVRLAADLEKVNMFDLLSCLENRHYVSDCIAPDYRCEYRVKTGKLCSVHSALTEIQENLDADLKSRTLASVLRGE
jgi:DNA-binding IscR family transcriptional regulator